MVGSYKKINYSLRPAKNIERKMICEALRELGHLSSLKSYQYIGFGSTYFSDFIVMHKYLGIRDMVSIEHDKDDEARFRFNVPYSCVDLIMNEANDALNGKIDWKSSKKIVWLDYDTRLTSGGLADVETVVGEAQGGSILLVTVNANLLKDMGVVGDGVTQAGLKRALQKIKGDVDPRNVRRGYKAADLRGWGVADLYRGLLYRKVEKAILARNGILSEGSKMSFRQIFNFHYHDASKMLTVGFIIYDQSMQQGIDRMIFFDEAVRPEYVKLDADSYLIETPNLTYRELRYLDKYLPTSEPEKIDLPVDNEDKVKYSKVYRYFPVFADTEL